MISTGRWCAKLGLHASFLHRTAVADVVLLATQHCITCLQRNGGSFTDLQKSLIGLQEAKFKGMAGEKTIVDKVLVTGNDDNFIVIKTLVRHVRCACTEQCTVHVIVYACPVCKPVTFECWRASAQRFAASVCVRMHSATASLLLAARCSDSFLPDSASMHAEHAQRPCL